MKPALLDLNVLIALAWPSHIHHGVAHRWFAAHRHHGWATCPLTQVGFVRISSNPAIVRDAVSPVEALDVLRRVCRLPHHVFWPMEENWAENEAIASLLLVGHRQVTDAALLVLAIARQGRLATLDRGLASLLPTGSAYRDALLLIASEQGQ
jgi:uncharacterized protein